MKSVRPLLLVTSLVVVFVTVLALRAGDPFHAESIVAPDDVAAPTVAAVTVPTVETTQTTIPERPGYVVTLSGAIVSPSPGEASDVVAAGGVLFPILAEVGDGYRVLTTCNEEAWVAADHVEVGFVPVTDDRLVEHAVIVVDPGHGLPDLGAVGPTGLSETEVNMAVSAMIVELLRQANDIDWESGAVTAGSEVPAVGSAIMTRFPSGPNGGDYQLGLSFRAEVANAAGADALVSIHHNTQPETNLEHPGAEAFVSVDDPESQRLGGLIVDELRRGLARFEADWTGSTGSGVISRQGTDRDDFYSLLARSDSPAVIVEGAYISNPTEEALARTDDFRQAYADGVYRALIRFITTDDNPIPPPEPVLWNVDTGSPSMANCAIPSP
ncbi:hypothetical protein BH23ACT5_BH23ACT5_05160 [soil metagenome]